MRWKMMKGFSLETEALSEIDSISYILQNVNA